MSKLLAVSLVGILFILIDLYVYQAVKIVTLEWSQNWRRGVSVVFWAFTFLSVMGLFAYHFGDVEKVGKEWKTVIMVALFVNYFSKVFGVLALIIDDVFRGMKWMLSQFSLTEGVVDEKSGDRISRSEFLAKTAIVAAAVPAVTMGYGIISGAHDYRVRRTIVKLTEPSRCI